MALVFLVVFLFLQNWRATLIPFAAVPVSLIGTFAGLLMLGYSLNTLTLFGMVLAIGIVVDDAIVVLENVERIMHEEHKNARDAAIQAMEEVSGPVIAIVLTLCAVFVPIAFLGGLTGELYRQFAVTIAIAVVLSGMVALTLTPSLCVLILKREHRKPGRFFTWFNDWFHRVTGRYADGVAWIIRRGAIGVTLFAVMVLVAIGLWRITPGSLVPDEDQGYYIGVVFLPDGATLQRTDQVVSEVVKAIKSNPANEYAVAFTGLDFIGGGFRNNAATIFVTQTHWDDRKVDTKQLVGEYFMKTGPYQGGLGARIRAAADLRSGQRGRLRVLYSKSRRRWPASAGRGNGQVPRGGKQGSDAGRRAIALARERAAARGRRRPREGEGAGRADRSNCSTRCRRHSARTTSTTSTDSVAPGKC